MKNDKIEGTIDIEFFDMVHRHRNDFMRAVRKSFPEVKAMPTERGARLIWSKSDAAAQTTRDDWLCILEALEVALGSEVYWAEKPDVADQIGRIKAQIEREHGIDRDELQDFMVKRNTW